MLSIELGRQEFSASHRPKIFVQAVFAHFPEDHKGKCLLRFFIANGGDTDATVVGYMAYLYHQVDGIVFAPELDGETSFVFLNDTVLKPGARVEVLGTHLCDWITCGEGERLFAIGRVEYEGGDSARRITGFCREYFSKNAMWQKVPNDAYEYTY